MISFTHKLQLHVAANGDFVLLRDGELVRPTEFQDWHAVPRRLPTVVELRLSIWNIDGQVSTQNIQFWQHKVAEEAPRPPDYSAIIVSSLYSRRLTGDTERHGPPARLRPEPHGNRRGLCARNRRNGRHSRRPASCYIPGCALCVRHSTSHFRKAKGMMINESRKLALGKWLLLLDSDIVLPPDFLAEVDALTPNGTLHRAGGPEDAACGRDGADPARRGAALGRVRSAA
jgi:hypothetical protein